MQHTIFAVILLVLLCTEARRVRFINSCNFPIDVEASGSTGVVCRDLGSGASCDWNIPASGWSGQFHRRNREGNNLGFPSGTLAEFNFGNSLTASQWNWDWFDISIIPPGCPGSITSYDGCWCNGGTDGYDVGMVIHPTKCPNKRRTCLGRKCDGAYQFPKDDSKTTVCQDVSGDWDVEFCPAGSHVDLGTSQLSQTPPCRGGQPTTPPPSVPPPSNPPPSNPPPRPNPPPSNPPPSNPPSSGSCVFDRDIDYFGNDLTNSRVPSREACCGFCARTNGCNAWTYAGGVCYAKRAPGNSRRAASGLWSGTVLSRAVATDEQTFSSSSDAQLSSSSVAIIVVGCIVGLFFIAAFVYALVFQNKNVERP